MRLSTGDTGRKVTADEDGRLYSCIFGSGCYVLSSGNKFEAEIQSNNKIKISDGDLILQGRHVLTDSSTSDIVTIANGSQGKNRKDLIVARYTKDSAGKESTDLAVITGTEATGAPARPGFVDGNILLGATAKDFPLYEVEITGINITKVTPLFTVLPAIPDLAVDTYSRVEIDNRISELMDLLSKKADAKHSHNYIVDKQSGHTHGFHWTGTKWEVFVDSTKIRTW